MGTTAMTAVAQGSKRTRARLKYLSSIISWISNRRGIDCNPRAVRAMYVYVTTRPCVSHTGDRVLVATRHQAGL